MARTFIIGFVVASATVAACVGDEVGPPVTPPDDAGTTADGSSGTPVTPPDDAGSTTPDADAEADAAPPTTFCSGRSEDVCEDFDRGLPPKGWTLPVPQYATTSFVEVDGANGTRAMQTHADGPIAVSSPAGGPSIARNIEMNASDSALTVEFLLQVDDPKDDGTIMSLALNATDVFYFNVTGQNLGFGYKKNDAMGGISFAIGPGWHTVKLVVEGNGKFSFAIDGTPKGVVNPTAFNPLGPGAKELRLGVFSVIPFNATKNLPVVRFENVLADAK